MKQSTLMALLCVVSLSCSKWDSGVHPDLLSVQRFSSTSIAPGASIQEVVEIHNLGGGAAFSPIVFTVSNFAAGSGLTVSLNNNAGVKIGVDSFTLDNADWDIMFSPATITFTSKPGIVIGPSYSAFIGLTITRTGAPAQGPDEAVTQTVTVQGGTGGGESPETNNVTTAVITKIKGPDLGAAQFFSGLQIAAGTTIQEVIQIRNLGTGPTTAPVTFTVSNYNAATGLTVVSNNSSSVTVGIDTYTLTNATDWDVVVSPAVLTFTSRPGVVIANGSSKFVGITITRAASPNQGANGNVVHTITITPGTGGGEAPATNNIVSNTLLKI